MKTEDYKRGLAHGLLWAAALLIVALSYYYFPDYAP